MKRAKICITVTIIFHTFLWSKIISCFGFALGKPNHFFIHKGTNENVYKRANTTYNFINRFYLKNEDDVSTLENALLNGNEENINDILAEEENTVYTSSETKSKPLTASEKRKNEIEQIRKKSESIILERSFSFNKENIQIKPELLKELITQKYRKMFQRHEKDCGSSEIQIIILTFKIFFLTEHMKRHKKDFACLRGLFKCVSKRRKLLKYLGTKNRKTFDMITDFFKIKKPLLPKTPEYYSKKLKYVHFKSTKRFKNNEEKKRKEKLRKKNVQTDKILFSN